MEGPLQIQARFSDWSGQVEINPQDSSWQISQSGQGSVDGVVVTLKTLAPLSGPSCGYPTSGTLEVDTPDGPVTVQFSQGYMALFTAPDGTQSQVSVGLVAATYCA